ncbi:hypothetical protein R3P38DRAFT_2771429 [Favolaschia claudopus]|uniref:Uncharacterized protein n=1 Tax=Favolaschia claudopus TaxID=2862362 RepID=A0AAW0CBW0_9AGAR
MQAASLTSPLFLHAGHRRTPATSLFGGASDEYHELETQLSEWFHKLTLHDQWSKCRLQNGRAPLRAAHPPPPPYINEQNSDSVSSDASRSARSRSPFPADIELDAARRNFARFVGAPPY